MKPTSPLRRDKPKLAPKESEEPELEQKRHLVRVLHSTGYIDGFELNRLMKKFEKPSRPSDIPDFTLVEAGDFNGCPLVEVLKDGGPVHPYDRNFQFGVRKAQMLLACVDILNEFWRTTDDRRLAFKPREITDNRHGLRVRICVEMHPDFELSTGAEIERPWLQLKALPPYREHIGLGAIKCRAICAVKEDLKRWLRSQGVLD